MNTPDWEERLERRLRDMDAAIEARAGGAPLRGFDAARPASLRPPKDTSAGERDPAMRRWAGLYVDNREAFFAGDEAELGQIVVYVFTARHVTGNAQYAAVAERAGWAYHAEDPSINAFATHGPSGDRPAIFLLGGAVAFARLCGALRAMAEEGGIQRLNAVWPTIGRAIIAGQGSLSASDAERLLAHLEGGRFWADERRIRRAVAFSGGMLAGVIAHELGHLALGHTLGQAANLEVSRNQEREADSFASSVISTSVFPDPIVEGTILWELAWAWCEHAAANPVAATHPLARERLLDFVRANETVAAGLGITAESLRALLP